MIISASQPYFFPYPGFFYKAYLSDMFIILDSVQFPRGTTWTTRNRFKNSQGTLWLTVPVKKKGLGLQSINEVRICHDDRCEKNMRRVSPARIQKRRITKRICPLWKSFIRQDLIDSLI